MSISQEEIGFNQRQDGVEDLTVHVVENIDGEKKR